MYDTSLVRQMFLRTCSHLLSRSAEFVVDTNVLPSSPCKELLPAVESAVG